MDESFEFLLSTQGFDVSPLDLPPPVPVTVDLTTCDSALMESPAPPTSAATPVCLSSDEEMGPTDDCEHDQTLTFIDFAADM